MAIVCVGDMCLSKRSVPPPNDSFSQHTEVKDNAPLTTCDIHSEQVKAAHLVLILKVRNYPDTEGKLPVGGFWEQYQPERLLPIADIPTRIQRQVPE